MDSSISFDSSADISFTNSCATKNEDNPSSDVVNDKVINPTKTALIDKIISIYVKHNLSLEALEDVVDFYNEDREDCVKLPAKKKSILKLFRENRDLIRITYVIKCDTCEKTVSVDSDSAQKLNCCGKLLKKTESNFFVYFPVVDRISRSIKEHWSCIQEFANKRLENHESISDAYDGEVLKKLLEQYEDSHMNIMSLCLNVDGASKFKSNGFQLWPIQLAQNYLPPEIRFQTRNIIVGGLYYGRTKVNCSEFMEPLVDELNDFYKHGFELNIFEEIFTFNPIITHCAVDLPAKSMLQKFKQFGGYMSCGYCKVPGEQILIQKTKKGKKTKKLSGEIEGNKFVCYVEGDEDYEPRNEAETLQQMLLAAKSKDDVDGVKGVSCMVAFKHFHIINSFSVDYMHCVLLGVTKQILRYFLDSKFSTKAFYITPKSRAILNKRVLALKPPAYIVRKPRSLEDRSNFKASEYRFFLLYYLPVCLYGLIDNVYIQHFRRLSAAVYILLKTSIEKSEVNDSEAMLRRFVKDQQNLFGKEAMVMNVHMLKHLAECVRELGPLWCHSAFAFERNNGVLLKMVSGTTDVLLQISSKYALSKSVVKKMEKINAKVLLGKGEKLIDPNIPVFHADSRQKVDWPNAELFVHRRIRLDKITYTSLMYTRPKKSIDYFIGLKNGCIGMAKFYAEHNSVVYVVMDEFEVIDDIDHIRKVRSKNCIILSPVVDIEKKLIYIKVGPNQFICTAPNPYEIE